MDYSTIYSRASYSQLYICVQNKLQHKLKIYSHNAVCIYNAIVLNLKYIVTMLCVHNAIVLNLKYIVTMLCIYTMLLY